LVDDAVLITKRIAEMVEELDYVSDIYIAHDFTTGLQIIEKENPTIILLDIHLPDKSGIELLDLVRKDFPHIKVIMVTNKVSPYYKDLCIEKGADYFVDKSKEFEKIPSILSQYFIA
jgi:CheY-like chemotaxis protein